MCGPHTVLPGEDPADYEHLLNALLEEHAPAGPTELLLVAQLAQAQWKLDRIACIEADLLAKHMRPNEPNLNPEGDMAPPVHSANAPLQFEPNLADAFERAAKSLAALARHEAAAHRAFDKALSTLWKLQGPRRHDDVERAVHAELEGFIDAYVNAPMPGAFRGHDPGGSYGPRATNPEPDSDNSNPIPTNRALTASSHHTASGTKPGSSSELRSTGSAPESSYTRP